MIRDYARRASGNTDGLLVTWTSSNDRQMFHIISYADVFNVLVVSEFTERVHPNPSPQGQRKSVSAERRAVSAERRAARACAVRKRSEQAAQKKRLEDQQRTGGVGSSTSCYLGGHGECARNEIIGGSSSQ